MPLSTIRLAIGLIAAMTILACVAVAVAAGWLLRQRWCKSPPRQTGTDAPDAGVRRSSGANSTTELMAVAKLEDSADVGKLFGSAIVDIDLQSAPPPGAASSMPETTMELVSSPTAAPSTAPAAAPSTAPAAAPNTVPAPASVPGAEVNSSVGSSRRRRRQSSASSSALSCERNGAESATTVTIETVMSPAAAAAPAAVPGIEVDAAEFVVGASGRRRRRSSTSRVSSEGLSLNESTVIDTARARRLTAPPPPNEEPIKSLAQ